MPIDVNLSVPLSNNIKTVDVARRDIQIECQESRAWQGCHSMAEDEAPALDRSSWPTSPESPSLLLNVYIYTDNISSAR